MTKTYLTWWNSALWCTSTENGLSPIATTFSILASMACSLNSRAMPARGDKILPDSSFTCTSHSSEMLGASERARPSKFLRQLRCRAGRRQRSLPSVQQVKVSDPRSRSRPVPPTDQS